MLSNIKSGKLPNVILQTKPWNRSAFDACTKYPWPMKKADMTWSLPPRTNRADLLAFISKEIELGVAQTPLEAPDTISHRGCFTAAHARSLINGVQQEGITWMVRAGTEYHTGTRPRDPVGSSMTVPTDTNTASISAFNSTSVWTIASCRQSYEDTMVKIGLTFAPGHIIHF